MIRAKCHAKGSNVMEAIVSSPMEPRLPLGIIPVRSSRLIVSVFSI